MHRIKIHTRDDSDKDYREGNDMDAKEEDEEVSKIDTCCWKENFNLEMASSPEFLIDFRQQEYLYLF